MRRMLRSKLVVCMVGVLALLVTVVLAGDVIVKPDVLQVGDLTIYKGGNGKMAIKHSNPLFLEDSVDVEANLDVGYDLDVGDYLDVDGGIEGGWDIFAWDDLVAFDGMACNGDAAVGGDLTVGGTIDPPVVVYEQQTRSQVIDRVKKEVPPDKQGGASLFFNKDTKCLETYIASEGKFYDLQGNLVYALQDVVSPVTQYEAAYYLDPSTGMVKTRQKKVNYKYRLRGEFELEEKTGRFIDKRTGSEATREEALEWYVENEKVFHDMQGNVLRAGPKEEDVQYVVEYRFDSRTGGIRVRRKAIQDRYALKEGYGVDRSTGKFVDTETGEIVGKVQATRLIKASEIAERYQVRGN